MLTKKVLHLVCLVICGFLFLYQCEEQAFNYLQKKKITSKSKVIHTSLEAPIITIIGQPPLREANISNMIYPLATAKDGKLRPVWTNETKSFSSAISGNYLRIKVNNRLMAQESLIFCYKKDARLAFFLHPPGTDFTVDTGNFGYADVKVNRIMKYTNEITAALIFMKKKIHEELPSQSSMCSPTTSMLDHQDCSIKRHINFWKTNAFCIPRYIKYF